jgi:hypothetical protein
MLLLMFLASLAAHTVRGGDYRDVGEVNERQSRDLSPTTRNCIDASKQRLELPQLIWNEPLRVFRTVSNLVNGKAEGASYASCAGQSHEALSD